MSDSTSAILAKMGELAKKHRCEPSLEASKSELLDAPKLNLQPGAELGNKLADILGAQCKQQHSPMD